MYNLTYSIALFFLFLIFLLFLLKQRQKYFEYYPQSWRMVMLGATWLVLAGGVNLVSTLNQTISVFTTNPLDPNGDGHKLIHAVELLGYMVGASLILVGFLKWCGALVEAKRNATRRLRQLACLNSLLSVINHRQEIDEILKESLSHLLHIMGYKMGVIFKPTFNSPEMTVVAHGGVVADNLFALFDVYSKNTWYKESSKSKEVTTTTEVKSLPEYGTLFVDQDQIHSFACVPIKFCERVLGLVGLYDSKPDRFSYQELQFLTSMGEILGLSAKQSLTAGRNKKRRDYVSAIENMLKLSQESSALEESFPQISTELRRIMDFDHISLAWTEGSGKDMKRVSIGSSGGMLVDKRVGISNEGSLISKVVRSKEVWLERHIDSNDNSLQDSLSKACGIQSQIIIPLEWGEMACGVLSLGHREPNFYSVNDAKWLKTFTLVLSHVVLELVLKEKLNRNEFLSRSLYESEKKLLAEEDMATLIKEVAASLTLDLPKSFARVSLLSPERDQLISCVTHQIRSEGIELKKEERFALDDLPWHRLTLEAKRPMLINQDDPESLMPRKEAHLIMDEKINSAILVPLILHDKAVGVISIGEMRNWERQPLTQEETAFIQHKANQICVALKKGLILRSNIQLKERLRSLERPEEMAYGQSHPAFGLSDLSYRINNSLTSIQGSAELLRLSESNLSANGLKYIKNIENGVDRIHKTLEDILSSGAERKESRLNQPKEELMRTH